MQHAAPCRGLLVGRDEHRAAAQVALIDDLEEAVGGVGAVGQVAELVDDEDGGRDIGFEQFFVVAAAGGGMQVAEQLRGGGEARVEAVLDGLVGDRDGGPSSTSARPSVTISGARKRPSVLRLTDVWKAKSNSSMVLRKGNFALRVARWTRVSARWAISSPMSCSKNSR